MTDDGETHHPQNFDFEAGEPKPPVVTGSGVAISTEFRYGKYDDVASVASAKAVADQVELLPNLTDQQIDLVLEAVEKAEMIAHRAGDSELADAYVDAIEPLHYASEARR